MSKNANHHMATTDTKTECIDKEKRYQTMQLNFFADNEAENDVGGVSDIRTIMANRSNEITEIAELRARSTRSVSYVVEEELRRAAQCNACRIVDNKSPYRSCLVFQISPPPYSEAVASLHCIFVIVALVAFAITVLVFSLWNQK